MDTSKIRIAIFASGTGTNAENLFNYFRDHRLAEIKLLLCNRKDAGVLERASRYGVPSVVVNRQQWQDGETVAQLLKSNAIDLIVLAGFLWLIPEGLVAQYPERIINIHPALLPKYGGKGMYGSFVHEAVRDNHEPETGITIHYVNTRYDEGEIIFQKACPVEPTDMAEDIAAKVHELEYRYLPEVVEQVVLKLSRESVAGA